MNSTLKHKCPNCNAILNYNEEKQIFLCEYCNSKFNLENISSDTINKKGSIKNEKLNPEYIIPFKITKEKAILYFYKFTKPSYLIPKEFKINNLIKSLKAIYIPFYLYDYDSTGTVEMECEKVSTWTSGAYKYKKTDKYKAIRGGNISFNNVPIVCSKKYHNDIIESLEPFDYTELKEFDSTITLEFDKENIDINKDEIIKKAIKKTKELFIQEMKKDINGYNKISSIENTINLYNDKSKVVLLPIWYIDINYKEKIYTFAMNGQTGKISGSIPKEHKRIIFIWLIMFIIIFVILLILNIVKVIL